MKGRIVLDIRKNQLRKDGFPVIVKLSHRGNKKNFALGLLFQESEWNFEKQEPLNDRRQILFIRKKKVILEELLFLAIDDPSITFETVKNSLLGNNLVLATTSFLDFTETLINEMRSKKDEKGFEKQGNAKVYQTAINQLALYRREVNFNDIDYNFLTGFKNWQIIKGNKKTSINTYLRTFRAIYNEAVRRQLTEDKQPFKDIFKSVAVKYNRTKKRHISKASVRALENIKGLPSGQQAAVDLWLLQFYFGGQDFKDIYYLENMQISKGRVYFIRGKLDDNGYQFDLKIFEKAQIILDKYNKKDRFVFPWRKDYDGYLTFIRRVQRNLKIIQEKIGVEIEPLGGNLTPKVSRHTFATIGSRLLIEPDLLRALMGHERDDVDTIYKDVYPQELRDKYHWEIIGTK